jgi:hypothetical protein
MWNPASTTFRRHPGVPPMPNERRQLRSCLTSGLVLLLVLVVLSSDGWALPRTYYEGGPGWDLTNVNTAFKPSNRRGAAPMVGGAPAIFSQTSLGVRRAGLQSADKLGSANFQLAVPIVRLPGRGLDLALDLFYNSDIWHKGANGELTYDMDADWPGPGWSLNFGKLEVRWSELDDLEHAQCLAFLVEPNGMHHGFLSTGQSELGTGRMRFLHHTTDGSLVQYFIDTKEGNSYRGEAKYPNGMLIEFDSQPNKFGELYPTRIVRALRSLRAMELKYPLFGS